MAELNWRKAYHEAIDREVRQFKAWRADPTCSMRVELPGIHRVRAVRDLTDAQIAEVARRTAEYATHEAMHKHGDERRPD